MEAEGHTRATYGGSGRLLVVALGQGIGKIMIGVEHYRVARS